MNLQSKFGYCLNIALCLLAGRNYGQTEGRTDRQTNGRTDDPITRCPLQTFQAGGIKKLFVKHLFPFHQHMRIGLTFNPDLLTWITIGIIHSSRTIYLPSLKLLEQSIIELSVAQVLEVQALLEFQYHLFIKIF